MKVRDNAALNCSFIKTTVGDFVCEVTSEFIPRVRVRVRGVMKWGGKVISACYTGKVLVLNRLNAAFNKLIPGCC